ncbi:hypothetical protein Riv7116_6230 [Rivularia sp. PCC 7116]|nr:hypothetical protein Riv7116_6230 [Rivularia sp. PCC 7116]
MLPLLSTTYYLLLSPHRYDNCLTGHDITYYELRITNYELYLPSPTDAKTIHDADILLGQNKDKFLAAIYS